MEGDERKFLRALKISKYNGWSVACVSAFFTFISLLIGDFTGAGVGLFVVLAGVFEIHGHNLLRLRLREAITWLAASQVWLFTIIFLYCAGKMLFFDPSQIGSLFSGESGELLQSVGVDESLLFDLLRTIDIDANLFRDLVVKGLYLFYSSVILASLVYQGGLFFYYLSRRKIVAAKPSLGV